MINTNFINTLYFTTATDSLILLVIPLLDRKDAYSCRRYEKYIVSTANVTIARTLIHTNHTDSGNKHEADRIRSQRQY